MKKLLFIILIFATSSCATQRNKSNFEYKDFARCAHIMDSLERTQCENSEQEQVPLLRIEF